MKKKKLVKFLNEQITKNNTWDDASFDYYQGIREGRIEMAEYVLQVLEDRIPV